MSTLDASIQINDKCCVCIMVQDELPNIPGILQNLSACSNFLIVDGGSSDGTLEALVAHRIDVLINVFQGFASQRFYLRDVAKKRFGDNVTHLLYIDADECLSKENIIEINRAVDDGLDGLSFKFRFIYCGFELKYAYSHPVVQRLFNVNFFSGRDEGAREYLWGGKPSVATHPIVHEDKKSGTRQELLKINANAEREASWHDREISLSFPLLRKIWSATPLVFRAIGYFFYRYFLKLGFLDGRMGLKYLLLNVLIYRLLVDSQLLTKKIHSESD